MENSLPWHISASSRGQFRNHNKVMISMVSKEVFVWFGLMLYIYTRFLWSIFKFNSDLRPSFLTWEYVTQRPSWSVLMSATPHKPTLFLCPTVPCGCPIDGLMGKWSERLVIREHLRQSGWKQCLEFKWPWLHDWSLNSRCSLSICPLPHNFDIFTLAGLHWFS